MEYCPYDSAFEILTPKEEKKQKKRREKAKVNLDFLDDPAVDPDRPALGNKSDVLSLQVLNEAFIDISSNITLPPVGELKPLPRYFLNGEDDYAEPFTDVIGSSTPGSSTPAQLPLPLNDNWKPVTPSNSYTAFYDEKSCPTQLPNQQVVSTSKNIAPVSSTTSNTTTKTTTSNSVSSSNDIESKIDLLFQRLDALEKEYKTSNPNNQKEILCFVGTGLVFLFGLNLLRR